MLHGVAQRAEHATLPRAHLLGPQTLTRRCHLLVVVGFGKAENPINASERHAEPQENRLRRNPGRVPVQAPTPHNRPLGKKRGSGKTTCFAYTQHVGIFK